MKTTNIDARQNYVNVIPTFKKEDADKTSSRRRLSYTAIQRRHHERVFCLSLGTSRGRLEEIAEIMEPSSLNMFYVQKARFRGKSVRRMK